VTIKWLFARVTVTRTLMSSELSSMLGKMENEHLNSSFSESKPLTKRVFTCMQKIVLRKVTFHASVPHMIRYPVACAEALFALTIKM
jgi:hypothetical protein